MGWLLGCFKCRQKNLKSGSINGTLNYKDERKFSSTAGLLGDNLAQAEETIEVGRTLSVQGDDPKRISSYVKTDRKSSSARRPSTEQLVQVNKLEEEIDSLNRKLVEEATQATTLTNEVRHLRNCSALLDSPNAFRKALGALEQALEKGYVEESQPLLYLQSLLSKIDLSEAVLEASSGEGNEYIWPKGSIECRDVSSLSSKKRQNSVEKVQDEALLDETEEFQSLPQVTVSAPVTPTITSDGGPLQVPKSEQSTCHSREQCSSDIVEVDGEKTSLAPVFRRRSSTTLSFSGFLVVEDVAEELSISDMIAGEQFSCSEFSVTKIIDTAESSESLFAFSTDSSRSHPSMSFQNSDSDLDPYSDKAKGNGSPYDPHRTSPKCLWSMQDDEDHELDTLHYGSSNEECQPNVREPSHSGFFDSGAPSLLSLSCSNSMDHSSSSSLDSEDSDSQHRTNKAGSSKDVPFTHTNSKLENVFDPEAMDSCASTQALSTPQSEDIGCDAMAGRQDYANCPSEGWNTEAAIFEQNHNSKRTKPELSSPTSAWSPFMEASPDAAHIFSPLHPVGVTKGGWASEICPETPSTPVSLYLDRSGKPHLTPLRTPLSSLTQVETPSTTQSQSSPSSIGQDRPILGTVAAHWNHSAVSTHKKWWDGKGIPNSTNKYKEDQKVSWHATPFEVRLERALAKQEHVFQKKLFGGAMASEMEVSM